MLSQEKKILSVSEFSEQIKQTLEKSFPDVFIKGEVGALSAPASGHVYFTLKDDKSAIRCILYRHIRRYLRFVPDNGQEILVRGRVSAYGPRSEYQIVVDYIEPFGLGSLYAAFLQLKKKLADKGYFAQERKRPLPFLPKTIGIVTSLSGAALHDMLKIIRHRRPGQHVVIAPTLVQGDQAPAAIALAIKLLVEHVEPDLIIVGRGGGSPEDLWAWNEEIVVEAVAECPVPVISGVGHEVDISLCDLAADIRAATPTHAAELAVPDTVELRANIDRLRKRMDKIIGDRQTRVAEKLRNLSRRLIREAVPTAQLVRQLDELNEKMVHRITYLSHENRYRWELLTQRLRFVAPHAGLARRQSRVEILAQKAQHLATLTLAMRKMKFGRLESKLLALSPLSVLDRGYAIVTHNHGEVLRQAANANIGETINIRFRRGKLKATVDHIDKENDSL